MTTTATREHPIRMNGEMVRAILSGYKTQTRRVVKTQPYDGVELHGPEWYEPTVVRDGEEVSGDEIFGIYDSDGEYGCKCPFGAPGDTFWVRETFMVNNDEIAYAATDQPLVGCEKWTPSIHMPRWAARIILEVTEVRVERLQEIPCAGVRAEGVSCPVHDFPGGMCVGDCGDLAQAFVTLWDTTTKAHRWETNPFVWVVSFTRKELKP